jgi:hypothetical protein
MGLHWLRKAPNGAVPVPRWPEALVFDPVTRKLVAVEYVVAKDAWQGQHPPSLFGHPVHTTALPNGAVATAARMDLETQPQRDVLRLQPPRLALPPVDEPAERSSRLRGYPTAGWRHSRRSTCRGNYP